MPSTLPALLAAAKTLARAEVLLSLNESDDQNRRLAVAAKQQFDAELALYRAESAPRIVAFETATEANYALLSNGDLWCWTRCDDDGADFRPAWRRVIGPPPTLVGGSS